MLVISLTSLSTIIEDNSEQFSNAESPILITLFGRVIFVKLEHPLKADEPILIRLSHKVIFCKKD